MAASAPANDYPRPDFERTALHWESLNGPWDFIFDDDDVGQVQAWHKNGIPTNGRRTIQVPFVFQAPASGINEQGVHQVLWYERRGVEDLRSDEERAKGYRLLLRCGAIDYHAKVWLDGQYLGEHRGGHVPFDLDLTDAMQLSEPFRLTLRAFDSAFDLTQPRGKQYWGPHPESIFYTPSSGIWQSVWLEAVPPARIADGSYGTILRSNVQGGVLHARVCVSGRRVGQRLTVEITSSIGGLVVGNEREDLPRDQDFVQFDALNMRLSPDHMQRLSPEFLFNADDDRCWHNGVALWTPECPFLYDVTVRLLDASSQIDQVKTIAGMRSLDWSAGDSTFRLNGRPYFQALFLDQGYWPETLMTPPSSAALKRDIELSKAMGMNGCRKHQKVEDPIFMYWADRLGFMVWGEMASCYNFSIDSISRFDQEWMEMVKRDINHPSIITWTPVNESWGYPNLSGDKRQRDHIRALYWNTKTYDPTRPINDNCGWEHVATDITSFHEYRDGSGMKDRCKSLKDILEQGTQMFLKPIHDSSGLRVEDKGSKHSPGAPVMCTEFGGINIAKHGQNDESRKDNWGYTTASDAQDLVQRIEEQVMAVVQEGHCCGIVWTQFTDIEQEQNGLYSYDREAKLPPNEVKRIMDQAKMVYHSLCGAANTVVQPKEEQPKEEQVVIAGLRVP